jgi:hypothetical protein
VTLFHHLKLWPVEALPGAIAEYSQSENPKPMLADKYEELVRFRIQFCMLIRYYNQFRSSPFRKPL